MNNQKHILTLVDFSNESLKALDFAIHIAEKINTKVDIINVIEGSSNGSNWNKSNNPIDGMFKYKLHKKNTERLNYFKNKWEKSVYVGNTSVIASPLSALEILDKMTTENEFLFLTLPYLQHSAIEQYLTSNVILEILRNIKTPTLFVPEKAELSDWNDIIFPSGFSEDVAPEFVELVNTINKGFNAKLHLVKVIEEKNTNLKEIEAKIEGFAEKHKVSNYIVNSIESQDVEKALDIFQQSIKANLICMTTAGKSSISQLFFSNSITETMLQKINKPILSLSIKNN
ncbi:MAG: universal stress protein [Cyclobacteriaceae bacterium]